MTITGDFERLQYFNFNKFSENVKPFLVESVLIENTTFPCKTALSKANVKINRKRSSKWTYHKEQGFSPDYFIFLKI